MSTIEILSLLQIIITVVLTVSILMQTRGSGLGTTFGGGGGESYRSKRGVEKFLTNLTIVFAVLFAVNGLAIYYFNSIN